MVIKRRFSFIQVEATAKEYYDTHNHLDIMGIWKEFVYWR